MFCPSCGTEVDDRAASCPNCGRSLSGAAATAAAGASGSVRPVEPPGGAYGARVLSGAEGKTFRAANGTYRLAGFWTRFGGYLIDGIIGFLIGAGVGIVIAVIYLAGDASAFDEGQD